jgi:hypothetical protein
MKKLDPIFLTPRPIARDWGLADPGIWSSTTADGHAVGEIWALAPDTQTDEGRSLGDVIREAPQPMLGDAGRAPPKLRMVLAGADVKVVPTAPTSLWCIIERRRNATRLDKTQGPLGVPPGDNQIPAAPALIELTGGMIAVEACSVFEPTNLPVSVAPLVELPSVSASMRSTLMRRPALSVEAWRLPDESRIEPDGETCHVLFALSRGVLIDGRELRPGQAVFVPAQGRTFALSGAGGRLLTAYPDRTPTQIWRHLPGPDPVGGAALRPTPEPASVASRSTQLAMNKREWAA